METVSPLSMESNTEAFKAACVEMYQSSGFTLMPTNRAKKPKSIGWQSIKPDVFNADNIGEFYAVVLPADVVVLDVDPRRYKDGENDLLTLWAKLELGRQETFIVRTGSGGFHIYFKKPPEVLLRGKVPGFPSIDIKTKGGYVMAAGSKHSVGAYYEIERHDASTIAEIPKVLLDFITRPDTTARKGLDGIDDSEANQQRFISWMNTRDVSDPRRFEVACEGKDYGLSEDTVFRLMMEFYNPRCSPELDERSMLEKVHNAFQFGQNPPGSKNPLTDFAQEMAKCDPPTPGETPGKNYEPSDDTVTWDYEYVKVGDSVVKKLKPVLCNITSYLRLEEIDGMPNPLRGLMRYNEHSEEIEFVRPAPWHKYCSTPPRVLSEADLIQMKGWFTDYKHMTCPINLFYEACIIESRKLAYHPIREYIKSIQWDGVRRLDYLLTHYAGCYPDKYTVAVGRCAIIGAVARVFEPGCQHDSMLVLEGDQNLGKTSFVRILGGQWFADVQIDAHSKDTIHNMLGAWIIEASEMDFTRKQEVSALKRFLTITSDKVRLSYERLSRCIPRQQIFIGTVNPEDGIGYLTDPTGNRRFHPVMCTDIRLDDLRRDRDQIFAEAYQAYLAGEPHHLVDPEVIEMAKMEAKRRTSVDSWEQTVSTWLNDERFPKPDVLTTDFIANQALNIPAHKLDKAIANRLARIMRQCGYIMHHQYDKSTKRTIWTWLRDPFAGL